MNTSLQSKLRETEDQLAGSDRRLKEMVEREAKVKEEQARTRAELTRLQEENAKLQGINDALQEENRSARAAMATKDSRLLELQGLAADRLARLEQNQKLLEAATDKVKAAEGRASMAESRVSAAEEGLTQAAAAAARAVEEYKDSDEFENDAATACVNLLEYGYADCLAKVKVAYPDLDLSQLAFSAGSREGGEDHVEDTRVLPDAGLEEKRGAEEKGNSAGGIPADGARANDKLGKGEDPKDGEPEKEGDPRNGESGTNASEPIVVESPEPERGQE